jgi:hypothetical protein
MPDMTDSLYQQLLGGSFEILSPILKRIHDVRPTKRYVGRCTIAGPTNLAAKLIAAIAGLPKAAADIPIEVTMECAPESERWTRTFGGQRMRSSMHGDRGYLRERLGPVVFSYALSASAERIAWRLVTARLWLVPLPLTWLMTCSAVEAIEGGRYTFNVSARVLGAGLIVHYTGWLVES